MNSKNTTFKQNEIRLGDVSRIKIGYSPIVRSEFSKRRVALREAINRETTTKRAVLISTAEKNTMPEKEQAYLLPFIQVSSIRRGQYVKSETSSWLDERLLDARTMRLQTDDILLLGHGVRYASALVPYELEGAICSSSIRIIRIESNYVLPAYLCWILNLESTIEYFRRLAVGTNIPFIPRGEVEKFTFPLPNIDIQKLIVEIKQLQIMEQELNLKLLDKKQKLTDANLHKLIYNSSK